MAICSDCGFEKPDHQVRLGTCDDCFTHGPPATKGPHFGSVGQKNGINEARTSVSRPGFATYSTDPQATASSVILTTSIDIPNRQIEQVISIVASEAALGMNVFRDIANNWRDFVGGRASSAQKSLKEAREACLNGLRTEAAALGADAVIAIDLDYNELSTSGAGGGILFVAASGTAVKLTPAI